MQSQSSIYHHEIKIKGIAINILPSNVRPLAQVILIMMSEVIKICTHIKYDSVIQVNRLILWIFFNETDTVDGLKEHAFLS